MDILCGACANRQLALTKPSEKLSSYPCGTCGFPRYAGAIHHCAPCAGCGVPSRGARIEIDSAAWCMTCYQVLVAGGMAAPLDMTNVNAREFMVTFLRFLQDERGAPISPAPAVESGRGRGKGSPLIPGGVTALLKKLNALYPEKPFDSSI